MATAREQLAQFAAGSKALGRLCREYKNRSATVHLEELVGGALSFYAAAAVAESGGVHVFVAEDRDAAAYLLNDFYNLLDERQVYFFPSSWKRSAAYGAEDAHIPAGAAQCRANPAAELPAPPGRHPHSGTPRHGCCPSGWICRSRNAR